MKKKYLCLFIVLVSILCVTSVCLKSNDEKDWKFNTVKNTEEKNEVILKNNITVNGDNNSLSEVENYKINYHCENPNNPTIYNAESETFALKKPICNKEHYFQGWYTDAAFTTLANTIIYQGTTGNLDFYPKFIDTDFKISMAFDNLPLNCKIKDFRYNEGICYFLTNEHEVFIYHDNTMEFIDDSGRGNFVAMDVQDGKILRLLTDYNYYTYSVSQHAFLDQHSKSIGSSIKINENTHINFYGDLENTSFYINNGINILHMDKSKETPLLGSFPSVLPKEMCIDNRNIVLIEGQANIIKGDNHCLTDKFDKRGSDDYHITEATSIVCVRRDYYILDNVAKRVIKMDRYGNSITLFRYNIQADKIRYVKEKNKLLLMNSTSSQGSFKMYEFNFPNETIDRFDINTGDKKAKKTDEFTYKYDLDNCPYNVRIDKHYSQNSLVIKDENFNKVYDSLSFDLNDTIRNYKIITTNNIGISRIYDLKPNQYVINNYHDKTLDSPKSIFSDVDRELPKQNKKGDQIFYNYYLDSEYSEPACDIVDGKYYLKKYINHDINNLYCAYGYEIQYYIGPAKRIYDETLPSMFSPTVKEKVYLKIPKINFKGFKFAGFSPLDDKKYFCRSELNTTVERNQKIHLIYEKENDFEESVMDSDIHRVDYDNYGELYAVVDMYKIIKTSNNQSIVTVDDEKIRDLCFGVNNTLYYISDNGLFKYNSQGSQKIRDKIGRDIISEFAKIKAVDGRLYIVDNKALVVLDEYDNYKIIHAQTSLSGKFIDIDADSKGNIYVSHELANKSFVLDKNGRQISSDFLTNMQFEIDPYDNIFYVFNKKTIFVNDDLNKIDIMTSRNLPIVRNIDDISINDCGRVVISDEMGYVHKSTNDFLGAKAINYISNFNCDESLRTTKKDNIYNLLINKDTFSLEFTCSEGSEFEVYSDIQHNNKIEDLTNISVNVNPQKTLYVTVFTNKPEDISYNTVTNDAYLRNKVFTRNTYEIRWTSDVQHKIIYSLSGGESKGDNPDTYSTNIDTVLKSAVKKYYTFDFWYYLYNGQQIKVIDNTIPAGKTGVIILKPKFTPTYYSVTYNCETEHENVVKYYSVLFTPVDLKDPAEKSGYNFVGWFDDNNNKITRIDNQNPKDLNLTARFELKSYDITRKFLVYDEGKITEMADHTPVHTTYNVDSDGTVGDITLPKYDFQGWFKDEELTQPFTRLDTDNPSDVVLYGKYAKKTYNIFYNLPETIGESTNNNPTSYKNQETNLELLGVTNEYFDFLGWYTQQDFDESTRITEIDRINGTTDIYLYGKFEKHTFNINYKYICNNKFIDNVNNTNPTSYKYGDPIFNLVNATKEHYNFIGWYSNSECLEPSRIQEIDITNASSVHTFYAKFEEVVYNLNFEYNVNGLANENPKSYTISTVDYILKSGTKDYYDFVGWYTDPNYIESSKITNYKELNFVTNTIYGKFVKKNYTIDYVCLCGDETLTNVTNNNPTTYQQQQNIILQNAEKKYYVFEGWYNTSTFNNKLENINIYSPSNITLYGKFVLKNYTLTYHNVEGLENENISSYNYKTSDNLLKDVKKYGYDFKGWYTTSSFDENSKITSLDTNSLINLDLYAKFEKIKPLEIKEEFNNKIEFITVKNDKVFNQENHSYDENTNAFVTVDNEINTYDKLTNVFNNKKFSILNSDSTEANKSKLATGMIIEILDGDVVIDRVVLSIRGDLTGDGNINARDLLFLSSCLKNKIELNREKFLACDLNNNNVIDASDLLVLKSIIKNQR